MFHAVGLNVIDANERKSDVLDTSRKALGDMIAKVVVESRRKERNHKAWRILKIYVRTRISFFSA